MKHLSQRLLVAIAALGGIAVTTPALVEAQAAPVVEYRQSIMQAYRTHMAGVRSALSDAAPMGHAEHHAIAFERMAQALANVFPAGTSNEGSRALPAVWENRDDFMNKVTDIQTASAALVEASRSGDADAIGTALQAVQGTCSGCHTTYRGPAG